MNEHVTFSNLNRNLRRLYLNLNQLDSAATSLCCAPWHQARLPFSEYRVDCFSADRGRPAPPAALLAPHSRQDCRQRVALHSRSYRAGRGCLSISISIRRVLIAALRAMLLGLLLLPGLCLARCSWTSRKNVGSV